MPISPFFLAGHCLCSILWVVFALAWKIDRRWVGLFAFLFFICEPAVFLVWGPFRHYWLYAAAFTAFLVLAQLTPKFYVFLHTQEALVRYLFWAAVAVFIAAVVFSSASEIAVRHDPLTFWSRQAAEHPTPENFNHLGNAYFNAGNMAQADVYYRKAAALDPLSIDAYEGQAHIAQKQENWAKSALLLQRIISLDPQLPDAYLCLGKAYRMLGEKTNVVKTYSRLLDLFPDDEDVDVKVIEAYGKAISSDPQEEIYKEKREEALADFEQLSKRKNYKAGDYYNLGLLYEQVGGREEAMRFYAKALQMEPEHQDALYNLANLYRDDGNYKAAMALYGRLIHFHPHYALGYLNMGVIFNALGDQERARRLYLKVIDLDPNNGDAYFNLGYLSESQGELNDAVNYYEKAVEVAPKNAEAFYNLGNVYASLGQNSEAIASYLKTIAVNPRHQDAFVNLSILSFKSRDFQGAIHYLEDAQALGYNPPVGYLKTLEPYRQK